MPADPNLHLANLSLPVSLTALERQVDLNDKEYKKLLLKLLSPLVSGTVPTTLTAGNATIATNASGATFNPLPSHLAKECTVINTTGTAIDIRYGTGTAISLPIGAGFTFKGITNTSQLQVRRTDVSNTPVTLPFNYVNW